jgi:hypothetical protein
VPSGTSSALTVNGCGEIFTPLFLFTRLVAFGAARRSDTSKVLSPLEFWFPSAEVR